MVKAQNLVLIQEVHLVMQLVMRVKTNLTAGNIHQFEDSDYLFVMITIKYI